MQEYAVFIEENIILCAVLAALLLMIINVEIRGLTKKYRDITPAEVVNLMNSQSPVLLDVRGSHELEGGTIDGARHIAADDLSQNMDSLEKYKEHSIIAFCSQGAKAPVACRLLVKRGFSNIYHLKGGINAWQQANMPIVK